MAFARGKYGVEYHRPANKETHRLRWILLIAVTLSGATFVSFSLRGCRQAPDTQVPTVGPGTDDVKDLSDFASSLKDNRTADVKPERPPLPAPKPTPTVTPETRQSEKWLATARTRPVAERTLLERLTAAEYNQNIPLAIDTIEKLRARPTMADLDEPLARRLGTLNMTLLLSGKQTPWTGEATVRTGHTVPRIAREHGTTTAALRRLNHLTPADPLTVGQKLRVLEFPRAVFVVRKRARIADVTLNGKFFKRYDVTVAPETAVGPCPITREAGPRTRFTERNLRFSPDDQAELEMLLAPGSSMTVSDQ